MYVKVAISKLLIIFKKSTLFHSLPLPFCSHHPFFCAGLAEGLLGCRHRLCCALKMAAGSMLCGTVVNLHMCQPIQDCIGPFVSIDMFYFILKTNI